MFTADAQQGKIKVGGNCSDILRVFMWKKELSSSAPVSIMSSRGWNLKGVRFKNFVTIRTIKNRNGLPYLDANSLKRATIYNVEAMQVTILGI